MRKGLLTGTALLLAFGATAAQAHDPAAARAEWLGKKLELSEEQQAQVGAIYAEAQEQRDALREQAREMRKSAMEQRKSMREQSQAIGESTRERLAEVLTEEQTAQLAGMRKDLDRRAIMRRHQRGGMRGRGMGWRGMERRGERFRRMLRHRETKKQAEAPALED